MSKFLKSFILIVVVLAVGFAMYFFLFAKKEPVNNSPTNSSLQSSSGAPVTGIVRQTPTSSIEASKIGQEFINQLLNLQAIKLNDEVFSSLAFQSLEDFTIVLVQPGNEGRPNPFAPFGADNTDPDPSSLPGITETDINVSPVNDLPQSGNTLPDLSGS